MQISHLIDNTHLLNAPPMSFEPARQATPLIPIPVLGATILDDIYSVGEQPSTRWRSFIDALNWDPRNYHDTLLAKRAYYARTCWEAVFLLSFTDSNWLSLNQYEMMQQVTHFELRRTEFEIVSYQLTCGMLGIKLFNHKNLLDGCTILFTSMMWIAEKIMVPHSNKVKNNYEDLKAMRPFKGDDRRVLAKKYDRYIFAINEFLKRGAIIVQNEKIRDQFLDILTKKLKNCVLSLDQLLFVFPNK